MINRMILNETSYFGKGAIGKIVDEVKKRTFTKGLVITDKGIIEAKVLDKVKVLLDEASLAYEIFDGITPLLFTAKSPGL